jgi:thiamine pyrophosphate-dependent acetolactate synthase large subunit-like protein
MLIADYIANQLFKAGVKYVFGLPGGPSIPYMEAFRAAGTEFILTSNESAAGTMADVAGRGDDNCPEIPSSGNYRGFFRRGTKSD